MHDRWRVTVLIEYGEQPFDRRKEAIMLEHVDVWQDVFIIKRKNPGSPGLG